MCKREGKKRGKEEAQFSEKEEREKVKREGEEKRKGEEEGEGGGGGKGEGEGEGEEEKGGEGKERRKGMEGGEKRRERENMIDSPLPCAAPSMIPGKSSSCMLAPLCCMQECQGGNMRTHDQVASVMSTTNSLQAYLNDSGNTREGGELIGGTLAAGLGQHVQQCRLYETMTVTVLLTIIHWFNLTLPTEGNPTRATRASPDFITSKPSP